MWGYIFAQILETRDHEFLDDFIKTIIRNLWMVSARDREIGLGVYAIHPPAKAFEAREKGEHGGDLRG